MDSAKRVIANTAAQYTKAIANICLSLYSTRLVLGALDVSDYGVYSVVAGIVGMLGYLTNALVTTTQRYLSFYHGKGDMLYVRKIFFNSLVLHVGIGLVFLFLLLCLESVIFSHFLNIDSDRLVAAKYVFRITVVMLMLTIVTAPFKSLLIARENIIYISIVEICDGILKVILALILLMTSMDKLVFYAVGMFLVLTINFAAYVVYCFFQYEESRVLGRHNCLLDKNCIKGITGFAGWTTFGMLAGVCQMQGSALVLNNFFGTVMNAAYGIAMQINGAVKFVSTSVLNAMNPQIMKAEGVGDRQKMLELSEKESKFSTSLMMILAIPIMVEMPELLAVWLKTVPEHTVMFSRALMIAFIIDQTTLGLHAANQATGHIRFYTIYTTIPKILIVPIMWGVLFAGWPVVVSMCFYVGIEALVACFRIPYMSYSASLNIWHYLKSVILPLVPLSIVICIASFTLKGLLAFKYSFLVSLPLACGIGLVAFWYCTLNQKERQYTAHLINSKLCHANETE